MRGPMQTPGGPPPLAKLIGAVVVLAVAAALGFPVISGVVGPGSPGPSSAPVGASSRTGSRESTVPTRGETDPRPVARPAAGPDESSSAPHGGLDELRGLIAEHASGEMVTVTAEVFRVLEDDHDGDRHQRFLIGVGTEGRRTLTVKVSHNIDLAPRVPVEEGDRVTIRGEFEWNELGGVIHWTHHDPDGRHEGGWIDLDERRYE